MQFGTDDQLLFPLRQPFGSLQEPLTQFAVRELAVRS
jgi:hypothetical protein